MSKYRIYEDEAGEWRFQLIADNGENVGPASEGYRDKTDAKRGALDHRHAAQAAEIEDA